MKRKAKKKESAWADKYGHDYRVPFGISIAGIITGMVGAVTGIIATLMQLNLL